MVSTEMPKSFSDLALGPHLCLEETRGIFTKGLKRCLKIPLQLGRRNNCSGEGTRTSKIKLLNSP